MRSRNKILCWRLKRPIILLFSAIFISIFINSNSIAIEESPPPSIEYQIKASLIFNFIQFIEWPEDPASSTLPFRICVLGPDQFGKALSYFEREVVFNRPIKKVVLPTPSAELSFCQVVFISGEFEEDIGVVLSSLGKKPILTIGESENFIQSGGIIQLDKAKKKIIFDINRKGATEKKFEISSKLLRLARTVID